MRKRTKKRIGIGIAAAVIVVAAVQIIRTQTEYAEADVEYEDIVSGVRLEDSPVEAVPVEETEEIAEDDFTTADDGPHYDIGTYPNLVIDHAALKASNPDYKGWLYVPCLEISYPVVRGEDNEYYLTHLADGSGNRNGCLFVDCGNSSDFSDDNTIIYGHHMRSGAMFASLVNYRDQDYYDAHPFLYLILGETPYRVDLFSGYDVAASTVPYSRTFRTKHDR